MGRDQINQFLKERRQKMQKVKKYREKRIHHKFRKEQQAMANEPAAPLTPEAARKMEFYKQVFEGEAPVKQKAPKQQNPNDEILRGIQQSENKVNKLKDRKKKYIKKMSEKTSRGQPVMKNYVKYALSKLEETIEKQKLAAKKEKLTERKK